MKRVLLGWVAVCGVIALQAQDRRLRPEQAAVQPAATDARIALVIGNASYEGAPLRNAVNDAQAMQEALAGCGFQVTLLTDASKRAMEEAIARFGDRIRGGAVGLFYYAGHGVQVGGENYLIPVGSTFAQEADVKYEAVNVGEVLDRMDAAKNRLNILILDACRNNPFARSWHRGVGGQGLAQVNAPAGSLIAYATAPGKTAADGSGDHGLYTAALLTELKVPGQSLLSVFQEVRKIVMDQSKGGQVPWESNSTVGDFYFHPSSAGDAGPDRQDPESLFWTSIQGSRDAMDFQAYLARYPNGVFRDLAQARLARMKQDSVASQHTLRLACREEGDVQGLELQSLVSSAFQARGWQLDGTAVHAVKVTVRIEEGHPNSEDPIVSKWHLIRATVDISSEGTIPLKGSLPLSFEIKGTGASRLRAQQDFKTEFRDKMEKAIQQISD